MIEDRVLTTTRMIITLVTTTISISSTSVVLWGLLNIIKVNARVTSKEIRVWGYNIKALVFIDKNNWTPLSVVSGRTSSE